MRLSFLGVFVGASCVATVSGHAYVYWPHSRQYLKDQGAMHSQNVERSGVKGMVSKWGGGPPGRGGARSKERMFWDLCGNPAYSAIAKPTSSWDGWGGAPVATYKEGGEIEFIVVMNGEHGGIHQFRLCDKKLGSALGDLKANAECIDKYFIGEMCTPGEGCGCTDDKCKDKTPHSDPNDPIFSHGPAPHNIYGAHVMKFKLPEGVSCDECTVQWYWATSFGEWFRNCIDIKIEGTSKPTPRPTPSPRPRPGPGGSGRRRRRHDGGIAPRRRQTRGRARRRRGARRRGPKPSRRRSNCASTVGAQSAQADGQPVVDMEYEEFGCFPMANGDSPADELKCDCDHDGTGGRTTETLRDFTCMKHEEGGLCRSGLPFYRLRVNKDVAVRLCFSFCSSRGMDLFGLAGDEECRCGASLANRNIWKNHTAHGSLLLDHDHKLRDCSTNSIKVYRYIGWMRYEDASGVQNEMLDLGKDDDDYINSIVLGRRVRTGQSGIGQR